LFFGAIVYLKNIQINNSAAHGGLHLEQGAIAFIKSGVVFGGGGAGASTAATLTLRDFEPFGPFGVWGR
jgi:hypothetical protein